MHGYRCGPGCYPVFILPFPWRCFGPCVRSDTTAALWLCRRRLRRGFLSPRGFFPRGSICNICMKILSFISPRDLLPCPPPRVLLCLSWLFISHPLSSCFG